MTVDNGAKWDDRRSEGIFYSMVSLPTPGQDAGAWGDMLNEFLLQSHNADGTLRQGSVTAQSLTAEAISATNATYDGTQYGLVGDGVTDDAPALQALVIQVSSSGGGMIYLPRGRYRLVGGTKWRSSVSLRGDGVGLTILLPDDRGTQLDVSAIGYDAAMVTSTNPMTNCHFSDFEIDGSMQTYPSYYVKNKGIFIQYCRNMVFRDIYIHDTIATGMGPDFLDNVVIDHVKTYNCGKRWAPGQNGGSGIGIGTGGMENENFSIVNCQTDYSGQYGIFVEDQVIFGRTPHYKPRGCVIANNIVKKGRNIGMGVIGGMNASITGNIIYGNVSHGFRTANYDSSDISLTHNQFYDNGGNGILAGSNASYTAYRIRGNTFRGNAQYHVQIGAQSLDTMAISDNDMMGGALGGIKIDPITNGFKRLTIANNTIHQTGHHGIFVAANGSGLAITGNSVTANKMSGIALSGAQTKVTVTSNTLWQNARYGLEQPAGASTTEGYITSNDMRGNTLGMQLLSGTNTALVQPVDGSTPMYRFAARNTTGPTAVVNAWTKASSLFTDKTTDVGNVFDVAAARFSCTNPDTAGVWMFTASISHNMQAGSKLIVAIYKNGTMYRMLGRGSVSTTDVGGFGGTAMVDIKVGDYVEVFYFTSSPGSFASATGYSVFEGYKL